MAGVCHGLKFIKTKKEDHKLAFAVFSLTKKPLIVQNHSEMMPWRRQNIIQKTIKQHSCANEHKFLSIRPPVYRNKTTNCSSGGYEMFVTFVCFVHLGFTWRIVGLRQIVRLFCAMFRRINQMHYSSQTNNTSGAYLDT